MKFTIVLALVLCICVAYIQAQRCRPPARPSCVGARDLGRGGPGCQARSMWYYQRGQCREMRYRGCGGNNNRWCSRAECQRRCRRPG